MKTTLRKIKQNSGIALIITVVILAVMAFYFVTYLIMAGGENNTVARSQEWNDALTVAEAGVEEGLALVNKYAYTGTGITNWSTTATADGWANVSTVTSGSVTYQAFNKTLTLPNNTGYYSVYVTNVFTNVSGNISYGSPTIFSIGTAKTASNPDISREIFVQTAAISESAGGVCAQAGLSEKGGIIVDSWDSSDPNHSIWPGGVYRQNYFNPLGTTFGIWSNSLSYVSNSFPSRTADVCVFTDSNVIDVVGNTKIAGYLQTGPNGSETMNGQSTVGDLNWCFGGGGSGLEPGHYQQNANMNFYSHLLPSPVDTNNGWMNWSNVPTFTSAGTNIIRLGGEWTYTNLMWTNIGGILATSINGSGFNIGGYVYHYVITNRVENTNWVYYEISDNPLSQSVFVDAQYVVLYLPNGLGYSGKSSFTVNNNADVQIWSGASISVSGQGVINNVGNYTHAFSIYDIAGDPISVKLTGNGAATGTYYLPSSSLQFSGGGSSGDFVGAVFCYSIDDVGGMNVHFDQSLKISLPPDQFIPTAWTEIAPN